MDTVPLSEAKAKFSEYVDHVADQQDRVVVTRNGRPAAVLVNPDDLESLEETLAVLSDKLLLTQIQAGLRAADKGDVLSSDEVKKRFLNQ